MKKKVLMFTLLLLAISLVAFGCTKTPDTPAAPAAPENSGGTASTPAAPQAVAKKVELTIFVFAAPGHKDVPREVVDKYMADHPNVTIEIVESSNSTTYPQMVAAREATPDNPYIHLSFMNDKTFNAGMVDDMWETIDVSNVPNIKDIAPQFLREDQKGITYCFGAWGLVYNKEKLGQTLTSYTDLWSNPALKGKLALWDYQFEMLVMAAMLNGGSAANIDPGFEVWTEHADQFHSFATSNEQLKNLLVTGEALATYFDFQQTKIWQDEGANLETAIPEEGVISVPLHVAITKGVSPEQKAVCEELINLFIAPDTLGKYAEQTRYVPTSLTAPIAESLKDLPAFNPAVIENAIMLDTLEMAKNNEEWSKRWEREVKSQL